MQILACLLGVVRVLLCLVFEFCGGGVDQRKRIKTGEFFVSQYAFLTTLCDDPSLAARHTLETLSKKERLSKVNIDLAFGQDE
jgi:hypothetical protein